MAGIGWMRAAVAVAGMVGATVAAVAGPAQAAVPVGTAQLISLPSLNGETIAGSRIVGSTLYVSHANEVSLFSLAGKHLSDLTGLSGAGAPVASTDGTKLFVPLATGKGVAVITTSTGAVSTWAGSLSCVSSVAVAGGRLFAEAGCDVTSQTLYSVSAADGTGQRSYTGVDADSPRLAGAADVLAVAVSSPGNATYAAYTVTAGGSVTLRGSAMFSIAADDLALSPDGQELVVPSGVQSATQLRTDTMSQLHSLASASGAYAFSWSPDGKSIAVGGGGFYNDNSTWIFDAATGSAVSASVHLGDGGYGAAVVSETLQYSADGKLVYSLARPGAGDTAVDLLIAGGGTVVASPLTMSATAKVAAGKAVTVKGVTLPGSVVTVTTTPNGTYSTTFRHVRSDDKGAYELAFTPKFSGKVTAYVDGDPTHQVAIRSARYGVVASVAIDMAGYRSSSGGVLRYTSYTQARIHVAIKPGRTTDAGLWLQYRDRHGWHDTDSKAVHFTTDMHGRTTLYLADVPKNYVFRVKARATAHNSLSLPSGFGYGKPFTIR